jgi:heptosyltransferase-1
LHTQSKFRLLVVRLGAMGDLLHALPAVTALRKAHPGWTIDWVVEPAWAALLSASLETGRGTGLGSGQPLVDGVHLAGVKAWAKRPISAQTIGEIRALRKALQAHGYDAVLEFQGAVRSAWIARMARCRRVIGEASPREPLAKWLFSERVVTRGVHVIEQDVEVAEAVAGDALAAVQPLLPVDAAAEAWCDALLAGNTKPIVLLNPGAGWGAKRWPVERYAAVAAGLAGRGFQVVVNAGPGEEDLAERIRELTVQTGNGQTGNSPALVARCTLGQLIALTRRVSLAVAGDTGPLHLACALGKPVVGIFGPTDPARNGPFRAPGWAPFRVLRHEASRRDHTRRDEPEAGLLTITPEQVLEAAGELLAEGHLEGIVR